MNTIMQVRTDPVPLHTTSWYIMSYYLFIFQRKRHLSTWFHFIHYKQANKCVQAVENICDIYADI